MDTDQILDRGLSFEFQEQRMQQEGVLWEGRPQLGPFIDLSKVKQFIMDRDSRSLLMLPIFGLWAISSIVWAIGLYAILFTVAVATLTPTILLLRRRFFQQNTRYAVSKSHILFQTWRWSGISRNIINWTDVDRLSYEAYVGGTGTLYFICGKEIDFDTYDFKSGERRFHPTFEMVPEVEKVWQQLQQIWRERKRDAAVEG